ncbi:MAG: alpha/beta fold hydrolase [Thermoanaerobaculales bacterium]|nr:alpha/beta fold hydrolase [Thermoanaerobaculales bacterium]
MLKARHAMLVIMVSLALGCAPQTSVEPERTAPSTIYTMDQLVKTVSVGGGSFNPDETKLLVHTNETGIFNIYELDIATGERTPVTEGDDTTYAVAYMPADERILFMRDQAGNEVHHLYLRELDGSVRDLTEGEATRETFFGFSHDLASFFTLNNRRDERFNDVYEWNVETLESHLIYENASGLEPAGISPDKRWLILVKINTTNDMDLFVADLAGGGEPQLISEHEGMATFAPADFSADSAHLYYTSNLEGEFSALYRYDLATAEHEPVFATDWDVSFAYFSRNGRYRVIGTNEDGYTVVRITDTTTGEPVELPGVPAGTISGVGISRSESKMRFNVSSDTMPANLYLWEIGSESSVQLTDNLNPEVDTDDLVESEIVRFTARDGMVIPGPLYKPIGASTDNKVPVLVWVHGGPGGQSRPGYWSEIQFLVNQGYGLFAVNNRGSSGYGKTFFAADDQKHGREPLWDCVDAAEYLKTLDWVDPERVGIIGGSYGGYMVLAALAYEPEAFDVGVDIFGVANWLRTLESIPPWWESFREALYQEMGNPETDAEMLREISPVFHADKIVRPLIILQGANDPRVLQAESDDMVEAIRANGGIVEYVVFEDEGHGFRKSANRIEGFHAVRDFLNEHLKNKS